METNAFGEIRISEIDPHPANRRVKGIDQVKLEQLAESIKAVGVQQPAVVRLKGKRYELVAGERRWRAAKMAGLETLPCVIRDIDDATTLRIQLIENLQREDVHPLDEADGYARLVEEGREGVEDVAREMGKSPAYVYQRLKLRDLIPGARDYFIEGYITAGHAIQIARLEGLQQKEVVIELGRREKFNREAPTVRELGEWIKSNILMELSAATWKMDDETLVPSAGSCLGCDKRSGAAPTLFEDLGKKDCCTDRSCFGAKQKAIVERRKAELEDQPHLEVYDSYVLDRDRDKNNPALKSHEWKECRKKDEGAVRVLIVGGDHPGRLTYGRKREQYGSEPMSPEKKAEAKEARAREKKLMAAQEGLLAAIYAQILEKATGELTAELLRAIAVIVWGAANYEERKTIAKLEKWELEKEDRYGDTFASNHIATLSGDDLVRFILVAAFGGKAKISKNYYFRIPDALQQGAAALGIDVEEHIAAAVESSGIGRDELLPKDPYRDELEFGVCQVCGCTDDEACDDDGSPCQWANEEHTLCSACAKKLEADSSDEESAEETGS